MKTMEHYICTGDCKGIANKPGTCQATDCPKYGEPLEKCDCTDDKHYDKQNDKDDDSTTI